jgi:hypothetical protein
MTKEQVNYPNCPECGSGPRCEDAPVCKTCGGVENPKEKPTTWKPIATAPKDNKRPLYLAQFKNGILRFVEVDGRFQHSNTQYEDRCWKSSIRFNSCSSELPTHWAYQDDPIPQVSSGWKFVPVEATNEMLSEGDEWTESNNVWDAMLAAAPQPDEPIPIAHGFCTWKHTDDVHMPDTWEADCGAMWSFIEGGPKDNNMNFCHKCGKPLTEAAPQPPEGEI